MKFDELGLAPEIMSAINDAGYTTPTPIQAEAIPHVIAGRDVLGIAQTGTGKTASFTLPMIHRLMKGRAKARMPRTLILEPTRELAAQVADNFDVYGKNTKLTKALLIGGVSFGDQEKAIMRGADVLIATPGRLLDLYNQNAVRFDQLEMLVLDEADRMLDMGFIHDIKKILRLLPTQRQNLLFSATFSDDIRALAKGLVNNPQEISVTPPNSTAERVEQSLYGVEQTQKTALLCHILRAHNTPQTLVFSRTKHGANRLVKQLEANGFLAAAIHGNKSQGARTKALDDFKQGRVQVLVATDIAARGIDIDLLPLVVNYDLPNVSEDYVHRIGRTARAGASGQAISLVSPEEVRDLRGIEKLIGQRISQCQVAGFDAVDLVKGRPAPKREQRPPRGRSNQGGQRGNTAAGNANGGGGNRTGGHGKPARRPR